LIRVVETTCTAIIYKMIIMRILEEVQPKNATMSDKPIIVDGNYKNSQQEIIQKKEETNKFVEITISGDFQEIDFANLLKIQQKLLSKRENININIIKDDKIDQTRNMGNTGENISAEQLSSGNTRSIAVNKVDSTVISDEEIHSQLKENYRLAIVEHEKKYKAALISKDKEIATYKEQVKELKKIIQSLSQAPIVIQQDQ